MPQAVWNGVRAEPDEGMPPAGIPVFRIGVLGGIVGMLCCVGPAVLALIGAVSAATAYSWAENLYGRYAWWFRVGGLVIMAALLLATLRRRRVCSIAGIRRARTGALMILATGVTTYAVLYAVTTCLGHLS